MGTIVELLKIIDKLSKKKINDRNDEDKRRFKEILKEEMKKINRDRIDTQI